MDSCVEDEFNAVNREVGRGAGAGFRGAVERHGGGGFSTLDSTGALRAFGVSRFKPGTAPALRWARSGSRARGRGNELFIHLMITRYMPGLVLSGSW